MTTYIVDAQIYHEDTQVLELVTHEETAEETAAEAVARFEHEAKFGWIGDESVGFIECDEIPY